MVKIHVDGFGMPYVSLASQGYVVGSGDGKGRNWCLVCFLAMRVAQSAFLFLELQSVHRFARLIRLKLTMIGKLRYSSRRQIVCKSHALLQHSSQFSAFLRHPFIPSRHPLGVPPPIPLFRLLRLYFPLYCCMVSSFSDSFAAVHWLVLCYLN